MSRHTLPLARTTDLNVQTTGDEILVFDRRTDKAYVLNPTAAAIWRASNGKRSVQEIASHLNHQAPTNEQTVWYALNQMQDLLEEPVEIPAANQGLSRRQFLKRAGLLGAVVVVPVVVSIVAPTPVYAQSGSFVCCICFNLETFFEPSCDTCQTTCSTRSGVDDCLPFPGSVCDIV